MKLKTYLSKRKVCLSTRQGSILAYSLIILAMMLAIATSLSVSTIIEKKSASSTEFSVQSLQTADIILLNHLIMRIFMVPLVLAEW